MPTTVFPETLVLANGRVIKPREPSLPSVPTGLKARGQTGKVQLRSFGAVGRMWTIEYPPLPGDDPAVQKLMAWVEWAWSESQIFTVKHPSLPGSGRAKNGLGTGTPRIKGSDQTGSAFLTDGWTPNVVNAVRAGDVWKIDGLNLLYRVLDDGNADANGELTANLNPTIYAGGSPADNAIITTSGCTLRVYLAAEPIWPKVPPGHMLDGYALTFCEAP